MERCRKRQCHIHLHTLLLLSISIFLLVLTPSCWSRAAHAHTGDDNGQRQRICAGVERGEDVSSIASGEECSQTKHGVSEPILASASTIAEHAADEDDSLAASVAWMDWDRCDILRISASEMDAERFLKEFHLRQPFILVNYTINNEQFGRNESDAAGSGNPAGSRRPGHSFRSLTTPLSLLHSFGSASISASEASTYSHARSTMTFKDYLASSLTHSTQLNEEAGKIKYFFGDHDDPNQWQHGQEEDEAAMIERMLQDAQGEDDNTSGLHNSGDEEQGDHALLLAELSRLGACVLQSDSDTHGFPVCSSESSQPQPSSDSTVGVSRREVVWSRLLRLYHPPPFVLPPSMLENDAGSVDEGKRKAAMQGETKHDTNFSADDMNMSPTNREVTPSSASQRILLEEAEAATATPTQHACSETTSTTTADVTCVSISPSPSSSSTSASGNGNKPQPTNAADQSRTEAVRLPPRVDYVRYSFGVGGHRSGVPFHFHGSALAEVMHGRKRWFLYPPVDEAAASTASPFSSTTAASDPDLPFPAFRPSLTQLQWLHQLYPTLSTVDRPLQCTLHPGELIYIPSRWYHATLNLGAVSVFVSSFVDDQRMEARLKQESQQP